MGSRRMRAAHLSIETVAQRQPTDAAGLERSMLEGQQVPRQPLRDVPMTDAYAGVDWLPPIHQRNHHPFWYWSDVVCARLQAVRYCYCWKLSGSLSVR
jgi:hypothetical protein